MPTAVRNLCLAAWFGYRAKLMCAATLELVARIFRDAGCSVAFNRPYANAIAV